jgi:hypothetical protein
MSIDDATPAEWDRLSIKYQPKSKRTPIHDVVHYSHGDIECIDAIKESMPQEQWRGYLKGQVLKYLWRLDYKGKAKTDCSKAQWYLTLLENELHDEGM